MFSFDQTSLIFFFFLRSNPRSVNVSKRETRSAKRNRTIMIGLAAFLANPLFPYISLNIRIFIYVRSKIKRLMI